MADAGWYRDPNDPAGEAYWDGRAWTGHRRPVPTLPLPPAPLPPPVAAPPPPSFAELPTAIHRPVGTAAAPAPLWAPQPAPPRRHRNRIPVIVALVGLVVLAAASIVAWLAWPSSGPAPRFTWQGTAIADPAGVLTAGESVVAQDVAARHGARNSATRCYFALPVRPAGGARKSDVQDALRCGPVLFVDGDPARTYLSVPLDAGPRNNGTQQLTPARTLAADQPDVVSDDVTLARPDDAAAPSGPGRLSVPAPPPAAANALLTAALGPTAAPAQLAHAELIGKTTGFTIVAAGEIARYGAGDDARSAPDGQRLIAFRVGTAAGDLSSSGTALPELVVDGGAPRTLPTPPSADDWVIAAVPSSGSVVLELDDGGVTQSLSLPGGVPGSGNIAVLARQHRGIVLDRNANVPIRLNNATSAVDVTWHASAGQVSLGYWVPGHPTLHAGSAGTAVLTPTLTYTEAGSTQTFGFDPALVRLVLPDGTVVRARNVAATGRILNVFEVPASFTTGTLQIAGTEKLGTIRVTVRTPVRIPVSILPG